MMMGFVAAALVYPIVRGAVKKPQEWAAGGFFVYYAVGWFAKLVYDAIANPRYGGPVELFIAAGLAGALVFAVVVRWRARRT